MAYSDPQSVTIGTTPGTVSVPRTSTGVNSSEYTSADGTVTLSISSIYGKRTRRTARITVDKITTDPLITGTNLRVNASVYVVLSAPPAGFSATEQKDMLVALATWLSASSAANSVKLVGGEN